MHNLNLGEAIKHFRLTTGISQTTLADKCKFKSQSRISQYEKNQREPSMEDISTICKVLGIDAPTLFRQAVILAGGKVPKQKPVHEELQTMFDKLKSNQQRLIVLETLRALTGQKSNIALE